MIHAKFPWKGNFGNRLAFTSQICAAHAACMRRNCYFRASGQNFVAIRFGDLDFPKESNNLTIIRRFQMLYRSKICCYIFISGLFDLMTLNVCQMLRSVCTGIFTKLELGHVPISSGLPGYNELLLIRNVNTSRCNLHIIIYIIWLFDLERLQFIGHRVIKLCAKFERSRTIRGVVIAINWGSYDILDLTGSGFSQFCSLWLSIAHRRNRFQQNPTIRDWVIDDWTNCLRKFYRGRLFGLVLRVVIIFIHHIMVETE